MSSIDNVTPTSETNAELCTGRVKWFNNKAGYGFITVTDGNRSGSDIFVHHSAVHVQNQQYKYLVQGEYVEFNLVSMEGGKHEFQASNVCGIKSGKLMCETRLEFKNARTNYRKEDAVVNDESNVKAPRQSRPRVRGEGPRESQNAEWTLAKSTKKPYRSNKSKTTDL